MPILPIFMPIRLQYQSWNGLWLLCFGWVFVVVFLTSSSFFFIFFTYFFSHSSSSWRLHLSFIFYKLFLIIFRLYSLLFRFFCSCFPENFFFKWSSSSLICIRLRLVISSFSLFLGISFPIISSFCYCFICCFQLLLTLIYLVLY